MSDRDVPSVPITTLAGLTSLSDLLSELPASDSISTASLNKSLLFHTLVAEESNNLLSVRDDNLVRQLVHAIEQTNSDHIELKSEYAINQPGTNISENPVLLQGIYTFKPTVFNTPHSHRLQNHQLGNSNPSHLYHQPQQQQKVPGNSISQNQPDVIVQQLQTQKHFAITQQTAQMPNVQNINNNSNIEFVSIKDSKKQRQQANSPAALVSSTSQANVTMNNVFHNIETPSKRPMNKRQIANEVQAQQQKQQQQQQQPQNILQEQNVLQQQQNQSFQQIPVQQQNQQNLLQPQQQQQQQQQLPLQKTTAQQSTPQPSQITQPLRLQSQLTHQTVLVHGQPISQVTGSQRSPVHQQQKSIPHQPSQVQQTTVLQQKTVVQQTPVVQKTPVVQQTSVVQQSPIVPQTSIVQQTQIVQQNPALQQPTSIHQITSQPNRVIQQNSIQQNRTPPIQQNPTVQKIAALQKPTLQQQQPPQPNLLLPLKQQQTFPPQPHITLQQQQQQPIQLPPQQEIPMQQQKTIPRNNEYLEQQSKNFDLRGPSPAQASVAPDSNQIGTIQQLSEKVTISQNKTSSIDGDANGNNDSSAINVDSNPPTPSGKGDTNIPMKPKVCLSRLKAEDEVLMQKSLKKFAKKSPELARKLGLTETSPVKVVEETVPTIPIVKDDKPTKSEDPFSQMKADERKTATKRKLAISSDDIPPEQIFTKPKLRKVERILAPLVPKSSKEEVMKSQTYQQFMRNMEQIIEQLDDTESPNLNSEDTDENIACISSKMLTVMSNDVAKLKAKGVLDSIPKNKLTLLINYAMRNVYLARHYSAGPDVEEEIIGDDVMEKILNATEACLLICNIYSTAKDLKFLQEDNISTVVKFVQFQFRETIFPSYDPVYTVKNMKKIDNRKKKTPHSHNRSLQLLYSKCVELMKVFVTLFDKCIFVDTIVLALSTLAIEPFFVDNIETLQFVCLELVTTIFRKEQYVKMRSSILSDILASVDRLPCSKKNLRPFKLANNGGNIQMVTALVLQLIQCSTVLPDHISDPTGRSGKKIKTTTTTTDTDENSGKKNSVDKDVIVLEKYDTAVSIGGNFLTTFLSKCKSRSNETDFRPLFENFIHDLLATVNKPEWPAAELLLSLLGTLLVKYMSDKTIEQSIRLASLDYLGIVAARLRKDTVESRCKVNTMDQMIKCIKAEQEKEGDLPQNNSNIILDPEEERTEFLQKILLDFLAVNAQEENLIWDYARHFYLAQWYRDVMQQRKRISEGEKGYASRKKKTAKKKRRKEESSESSSDEDEDKSDDEDALLKSGANDAPDQSLNLEIFQVLEERKKYLLRKIKPYSDINCTSQHIKTYIDYNNAHLIAQYLASKRPFSQSFDKYLQKIILVVREPAIAIRTRAMKCLANIVEVDPLILKRKDMQMGVNQKFLDTAISVREAAVDLIGKYVLSSEELIDQYYEMLSARILDTGVSVRKRVIKILRDICIEYPDFPKIPEICVKMIRRVNDEEGIQKLVTEVFMRMWFTPCRDNDRVSIHRKINQIIDVVNTAHDTGLMWLDGLLNSIFTPKENNSKLDSGSSEVVKKNTEPSPEVVLACQQLADGLVERLIELEDTDNTRMLGCITTIHLLAKVRPQLLVRHAITIEPYLNIKCHSTNAPKFICSVAEILEQVVPLMEHPSESFLADLEEHLMILVVSLNQTVVLSCLSCLGAVVNKITKNYKLIRDCFSKFYRSLFNSREQLINNPSLPIDNIYQPIFRRSLYTIGILMRYFDFKSPKILGLEESGGKISSTICDEVFDSLMYFITCSNFEIRKQALVSLGHFCVQNDEYLTRPELKDFYRELLTSTTIESHIKLICMRNIWMYLTESEIYMHNKEKDWHTQSQMDDLKEMNDVSSGMASRIIQLYLQEILNCFLHNDSAVRLWAVKVIQIVLRQGLVHPVRMVPYLICLSTDEKTEIAHRADALLKDIDKTYSGFVNMKLQLGLQLSFQLQELLQTTADGGESQVVRGYIIKDKQPVSLNDFLYSLLRNTKPQRRALVQTVTKQFDDQKTTLRQMLFLADNLAYFPYVVQDEPLYLIHHIDLLISVTGTNMLATFKEGLKPFTDKETPLEDDDDEEDKEVLYNRLPEDTTELQKCIISAQACMLLLILKQHLKDIYGITDGKISRYSPSESQKIYEKAVTKKPVAEFNPKSTIEVIKKTSNFDKPLDEKEKRDLIDKYLDFKQLMLRLDPDDVDSQDEEKLKLNNSITTTPKTPATHNSTIESHKEFDGGTPHVNNVNSAVLAQVVSQKDIINSTPTTRNTNTKSAKSVSVRKQPVRSKRKKRKIISSDDEDSDYSDGDYV